MNAKGLAKEITKREGKKIGVNIAQVTEIIGVLADMSHQSLEIDGGLELLTILLHLGEKRSKKRQK